MITTKPTPQQWAVLALLHDGSRLMDFTADHFKRPGWYSERYHGRVRTQLVAHLQAAGWLESVPSAPDTYRLSPAGMALFEGA